VKTRGARDAVRQYDDEDGCPSCGGLPLARLTNLQWLRGKNRRWKKGIEGKRNGTRRRFGGEKWLLAPEKQDKSPFNPLFSLRTPV